MSDTLKQIFFFFFYKNYLVLYIRERNIIVNIKTHHNVILFINFNNRIVGVNILVLYIIH